MEAGTVIVDHDTIFIIDQECDEANDLAYRLIADNNATDFWTHHDADEGSDVA